MSETEDPHRRIPSRSSPEELRVLPEATPIPRQGGERGAWVWEPPSSDERMTPLPQQPEPGRPQLLEWAVHAGRPSCALFRHPQSGRTRQRLRCVPPLSAELPAAARALVRGGLCRGARLPAGAAPAAPIARALEPSRAPAALLRPRRFSHGARVAGRHRGPHPAGAAAGGGAGDAVLRAGCRATGDSRGPGCRQGNTEDTIFLGPCLPASLYPSCLPACLPVMLTWVLADLAAAPRGRQVTPTAAQVLRSVLQGSPSMQQQLAGYLQGMLGQGMGYPLGEGEWLPALGGARRRRSPEGNRRTRARLCRVSVF